MKISITTQLLQKKLSFITKAISTKSQLPVLLNILLETHEGKLLLSSTDLEIGMQTSAVVSIDEEGGITVPARTFVELINSLSDPEITLTTKDGIIEIATKHTKSTLPTIAKEEFPKLFEERGEKHAVMQTANLKKEFPAVIFSASADLSRPALSGVLLVREETGFLLVATDGYRLSLKHHVSGSESNDMQQLIVPARIFRELLAIKDEVEEVILFIAKGSNQVIFEIGESIIVGRLIEATYPNYEKIIPLDFSARISFNRQELLKAAKICSIFAREAANIINFSLRKNSMIVTSQTPSLGGNTVEVAAELQGEENEIAFNARYVLDILTHAEAEDMVFEMSGPLNPGVFKIKDDDSFLHLIMPIRVQQ